MDKDTKVLLMAVVIILVALVSFNLTDLTGKVTSEASITVETTKYGDVVEFTEYDPVEMVTVNVYLGDKKVDDKMYLYTCDPRKTEKRLSAYSVDLCEGSTCTIGGSYEFRVSTSLNDGMYCFYAKKGTEVVAKSNRFTVRHV